jgi:serine/threonine-protein kinase
VPEPNDHATDPLRDQLQVALEGRYALQGRVGAGGMALVYLATDLRHQRRVAVKVVRPELSASVGRDRFLREIETAARLQHPHIVPVYDSGETDGVLYYVMPYVEGESLRDRLTRERQLPVEDVVRITREVAEALSFAHANGIVHRDIKPENILLSGNTAVVSDFGIARALAAVGTERLTESGLAIGTPYYMSPEQASGESSLDTRADVYSLGCVVHEMLVGEPPFTGPSLMAIIARHSVDPVRSLRTVRPEISLALESTVLKALAKTPADRWGTSLQLATALEESVRTGARVVTLPRPRLRRSRIAAAAVAVTLLAAIAVALFWRGTGTGSSDTPMVVVLPFDNFGPETESYFAEGLTDEITSRLASISGLGVISRSSAAAFRAADRSPSEIAKELGADYVLIGSITIVRRATGNSAIRVIPHLAAVATDREIWTQRYEVELVPGEILGVQGGIAQSVAQALDVRLTAADTLDFVRRPTDNLAAYDAYLRGNLYASQIFPGEPLETAIGLYEEAVALDSGFALAFAKLGQAQSVYNFYYDRTPERQALARTAVDRARALEPDLPEARLALGYYYYWAEQDYERAWDVLSPVRASEPNDSELHWIMGSLARRMGRWDEAVELMRQAVRLNPRSQLYAYDLASIYHVLRQLAEAERYYDQAIDLAPDWIAPYLSKSLLEWSVGGDTANARVVMDAGRERVGMTSTVKTLVENFRDHLLVLGGEYAQAFEAMTLDDVPMDSGGYYLARAIAASSESDGSAARSYYDSARVIWEARVAASPEDPRYRSGLSHSLAGLGAAEAAREGQQAVALATERGDVHQSMIWQILLTRTYVVLGDLDRAAIEAESLLEEPSLLTTNWFRFHPLFVPLAQSPRLQRFLR